MTGKTTIEWTWHPGYVGAVWNPTVGCTRVSAGCDLPIVAADERARAPHNIEAEERRLTSAGAGDKRIRLAGIAKDVLAGPVMDGMCGSADLDNEVRWPVIRLVAIPVVNLLPLDESTSEHLFSDETVLVDVSAHIGTGMADRLHEHIAIRSDAAPALPVWVVGKRELALTQRHLESVAR